MYGDNTNWNGANVLFIITFYSDASVGQYFSLSFLCYDNFISSIVKLHAPLIRLSVKFESTTKYIFLAQYIFSYRYKYMNLSGWRSSV